MSTTQALPMIRPNTSLVTPGTHERPSNKFAWYKKSHFHHAIHAGLVSSQMASCPAQLLAKKCCWPEACHHACTHTHALLQKMTNQLISGKILAFHEFHDQTQNYRKKYVQKKSARFRGLKKIMPVFQKSTTNEASSIFFWTFRRYRQLNLVIFGH